MEVLGGNLSSFTGQMTLLSSKQQCQGDVRVRNSHRLSGTVVFSVVEDRLSPVLLLSGHSSSSVCDETATC